VEINKLKVLIFPFSLETSFFWCVLSTYFIKEKLESLNTLLTLLVGEMLPSNGANTRYKKEQEKDKKRLPSTPENLPTEHARKGYNITMVAYKLDHALGGKASTQRRITNQSANTIWATNVPERGPKRQQRQLRWSRSDNSSKVSARGTSNSGKASTMINDDGMVNSCRTNHRE
jgi:hypothetical protein